MMTRGKRIAAIAALVIAGGSASVWAFGRHGPHGWAGPFGDPVKMARLAERLDLTTEQRDRIDEIVNRARHSRRDHIDALVRAHKTYRDLLQAPQLDEAAVRELARAQSAHVEALMVIGARTFAEVRSELTPEQRERLARLRFRHRGWHGGGHAG